MNSAYLRASFLGVISVLLIDAFFVFSSMPTMFSFLIFSPLLFYIQICYGSILGCTIQYLRQHSIQKQPNNIYSNLRYVLSLLVFNICITYVATFGSFLTYFPLVIYCLYNISIASFALSVNSLDNKAMPMSRWISHIFSAMFIGSSVAITYWALVYTLFSLTNPIISFVFHWGVIGAINQTLIVLFLYDCKLSVLSQWVISATCFSISIVSILLATQPFLSIFLFTATPVFYGIVRCYISPFNDNKWDGSKSETGAFNTLTPTSSNDLGNSGRPHHFILKDEKGINPDKGFSLEDKP